MSFLKSLRKQKTQYEFSLLIVSGKDLTCITEGQAIVCILKRKDKSLQTKVSLLGSDRTATWNERLDFTAAMWSDKKGFETKPYTVCISVSQCLLHTTTPPMAFTFLVAFLFDEI